MNMNLSKSLQDNINTVNELLPLNKSFDLVTRRMKLCRLDSYFIGINGYCDSKVLNTLLKDLHGMDFSTLLAEADSSSAILNSLMSAVPVAQIEYQNNWDSLLKSLLSGTLLIFFEGVDQGFTIDIRQYPVRSIDEPQNEKVIRGAKDGFVETLLFNANLIRRRIRSPQLTFEALSVGSISKTDVAIAYMKDKADSELLNSIRTHIQAMDVAALTMGTRSMEELLVPHKWYHPLPALFRTERPDVACSYLLEGYTLLMVDTTPSVLVLPCSIFQFTQSPEDYYKSPLIGNYIRFYRFLCSIVSLFLLPLFLLFAIHPELLPGGFSLQQQEYISPLQLCIYVFFAEIALDLFRYSSSHSPEGFSGALAIVGGLLIGDTAVTMQWASREIIFYAAATVLASLSISSIEFSEAIRMYRFLLLFCTGAGGLIGSASNISLFGIPAGLAGFLIGCVLVGLSIVTTPAAFGKSYFWPLIPFNRNALRALLFRYPAKYKQPPQIWRQK